jgi:hypothetical protein
VFYLQAVEVDQIQTSIRRIEDDPVFGDVESYADNTVVGFAETKTADAEPRDYD